MFKLKLRVVIGQICFYVQGGSLFFGVMVQFFEYFLLIMVNMVWVGEVGGFFDEVFV